MQGQLLPMAFRLHTVGPARSDGLWTMGRQRRGTSPASSRVITKPLWKLTLEMQTGVVRHSLLSEFCWSVRRLLPLLVPRSQLFVPTESSRGSQRLSLQHLAEV